MKKYFLLFFAIFLSLTFANANEIKNLDINGVKNIYVDAQNNKDAKFICDSISGDTYINNYVSSHASQYCKASLENALSKKCENEGLELMKEALCSPDGEKSKANLINANQILQKYPLWQNAWIWQKLNSGTKGCYTGTVKKLMNKIQYCK